MRVLVTGASGFLGSRLCQRLLTRGDQVVGLTRDPARARGANPAITWHAWNAASERPPNGAFQDVDAVVNLVGESLNQRWTDDSKRRILESRERATKNLVDAISATERRPGTLVSQSAVGYYGDSGESVVDESTGPGSGFDAGVCVAWEEAAGPAEHAGVRVVVTRTGLVLDPNGGLLKDMLLPFRLGLGGPLAGGRQYMPWIHVEDEISVLLWAVDTPDASGTYNATAPNPVTNAEFTRALGRVLGRPTVVPVPKLALKARFGGEAGEAFAASLRVVPRRLLDAGFRFSHPELESALRDLLGRS